MSLNVDVEGFRHNGFVIAHGVFSTLQVSTFRERIGMARERVLASRDCDNDPKYPRLTMFRGDCLSIRELRDCDYVIFDEHVISLVKQLLGPRVVYHGDSSVQIGEGPRGFHKDNADRGDASGVDWNGEYGVLRMAAYLQDHARHSGGLKVRRQSHHYVSHHRGQCVNLDTTPGDVVFWYLTTTHSGNVVRARGAPGLSMHPRFERLVPQPLRVPESAERMAIFCTYGAPGVHLDHYINYQATRPDVPLHWRRCGAGPEFDALAIARGVELRRPSPEFGAHAATHGNLRRDPTNVCT
jgi:hypothetical protein